jgi:ABC-2 type transport system permease protein
MKRNSLLQLILIHYREFIREPGIIFWSIIFPVLMAWVLGIAFSRNDEMVQQVAFIEDSLNMNLEFRRFVQDGTRVDSERGADYYEKTIRNEQLGATSYRFLLTDWEGGVLMLKRGQVNLILREYTDSIGYYFDPANPQARTAYIMLSSVINNEQMVYETDRINPLTQRGNRYIDFLVPGLMALGLMNSLLWGMSYALIDMRSKKLMRRMVATPMKKSEFLLSFFIARLSITIIEALLLLGFAVAYFQITIQGSLAAFILVFLAGNIAFSGIAILISSRTANSRIGTGLINVITLPMMILSGVFFSYHNFPDFVIPIIQKLPLTMLADSLRSIFIEGSGIARVSLNALALALLGIACFLIGLRTFKWY